MARKTVAVEIDHSQLMSVVPLERGTRGQIDLTTIAGNQRRAIIRLFVTAAGAGGEHRLLTSLEIRSLARYGRSKPSILLRLRVGRGGTLSATVVVEGRVALKRKLDVSAHLEPGSSRFPWAAAAAILALLLLAGLGGTLLLRSMRPEPVAISDRAPAVLRPAAEPVRPTPPAAVAVEEQHWTVYFSPDSAELTAAARRELQAIAAQLSGYPAEGVQIEIDGHCAPAGWERGRLQLSHDRAGAVARFLTAAGAPEPDEVRGYSSDRPIAHDPDRLHLNRRVEISVSPAPPAAP